MQVKYLVLCTSLLANTWAVNTLAWHVFCKQQLVFCLESFKSFGHGHCALQNLFPAVYFHIESFMSQKLAHGLLLRNKLRRQRIEY